MARKDKFTVSLEGMGADGIYQLLQAIEENSSPENNGAIDFICDYLGANATRLLAEALVQNHPLDAIVLHDLYDDMTPGWDAAVNTVFNWRKARIEGGAPQYDLALQAAANEAVAHPSAATRARFAGMAELASTAIEVDGPDEAEEILQAFHEIYGVPYAEVEA